MEHLTCFWCGGTLNRFYNVYPIGGVSKPFHFGLAKDCLNDYLKWNNSQQPRLQLIGGKDGTEHRDGVKGLRGGHRVHPRISHPTR